MSCDSVIQLYSYSCTLKENSRKVLLPCLRKEEKLDNSIIQVWYYSLLPKVFSLSPTLLSVSLFFLLSLSLSFLLFPFIVSSFSFGGEIKDYRAYIFSDGVKSTTCECVSACKLVFAPKACEHTVCVIDFFFLSSLEAAETHFSTISPSGQLCLQRLSSLLLSPSFAMWIFPSLFFTLKRPAFGVFLLMVFSTRFLNQKAFLATGFIKQTMLVNIGKTSSRTLQYKQYIFKYVFFPPISPKRWWMVIEW